MKNKKNNLYFFLNIGINRINSIGDTFKRLYFITTINGNEN